ncbi:PKD domain-containing protein [Mucilaginibacter sp. 21P]|uniref:PKD domain-containing protein n=1 Tax=Mucilaginibacter sp. 21P TaxID=2778902 RepID=UPI001C58F3ED|nr:PKD domain-containing protein [Mucilaginibacter sp. 21P]QXV63628.1 PKD domain-containing protein [Mucilaginibacter sp. 21P]
MSIFITSDHNSSGIVTANTFSQRFTVQANQVTEIQVPRDGVYIENQQGGEVMALNHAIHIQADENAAKIVVYAHIFAGNRSAATLVLPKEALGQDYYSMNYPQKDMEGRNLIDVVAIEPDTRVRITRNGDDIVPGGVLLKSAGDVYQLAFDQDMTGIRVSVDAATSGCKRFALFSGSNNTLIAATTCISPSRDPLFQQNYPVQSWGTKYGFIPFSMESKNNPQSLVRTRGQYIRVVAKENGTVVKFNGNVVATLEAGKFYSSPLPIAVPTLIEASQPVAVAQFAISQECATFLGPYDTKYSDPDMVILNPISYNIRDITIYSSSKEHIKEQYVNILIRSEDASSFRINGQLPPKPFIPASDIPGYAYNQIDLTGSPVQTFHLQASGGFNGIAYGFGFVESYSYSAGTNLASSIAVTGIRTSDQALIDSACSDEDFSLRLALPFVSEKISWQINGTAPIVQQNPPFKTTDDGIRKTYYYTLPKPASMAQAGSYEVKVTAAYHVLVGGCNNGEEQAEYTFKTLPKPIPEIITGGADCSGNVSFSAPEIVSGQKLKTYQWDFGDINSSGNSATGRQVSHLYGSSGEYTVKLTVLSDAGCQAESIKKISVKIYQPELTASGPACPGKPVNFGAKPLPGFSPVKWVWDFGDQTIVTTYMASAEHYYTEADIYTVRLSMVDASGCSTAQTTVLQTIVKSPESGFTVLQSCAGSPAQFSANAMIGQGSLSYDWDFGDQSASAVNNRSALSSPSHQYAAAGSYTVKLTVRNSNGCESSSNQTINVSGPPKADFELLSNPICAGEQVVIRNRSFANGGNITRIDVYFDAANAPDEKISIQTPLNGQEINYRYTQPVGIASRPVMIRLVAWSGNTCNDEKTAQYTLLAKPELSFSGPAAICISDQPVQLTGSVSNAVPGTASYSGAGLSATGFFDPQLAGPGHHTLTFRFLSAGGCEAYKTIELDVRPDVDIAGETTYTYSLNPVAIRPTYKGEPKTYSWTPATGLNDPATAFPLASPPVTTVYTVTVSNGFCTQQRQITVNVAPELEIHNSFTPNNDGINDLFTIGNIDNWKGAQVSIYNRYGTMLYQSRGKYQPWDGKYNGKELPAGAYYYVIITADGRKKRSGSITLIR